MIMLLYVEDGLELCELMIEGVFWMFLLDDYLFVFMEVDDSL